MKEKCLVEEFFAYGIGTLKYFLKNAKKIIEDIKEEKANVKFIDLHDLVETVKEIPKKKIKDCLKNMGFITVDELQSQEKEQ